MAKKNKERGDAFKLVLLSLFFLLIIYVVWNQGDWQTPGHKGVKGQRGFEKIKVLDHIALSSNPNTRFTVVFINMGNVSVNGSVQIDSTPPGNISYLGGTQDALIAPEDTVIVSLTSVANECPTYDRDYDIAINITWTDIETGETFKDQGRIWGPC